jgi:hypothetical protein
MKRPNRLYIWWLDNSRRLGIVLLIVNLTLPLAFLAYHLLVGLPSWSGKASSRECGMGRYTYDC